MSYTLSEELRPSLRRVGFTKDPIELWTRLISESEIKAYIEVENSGLMYTIVRKLKTLVLTAKNPFEKTDLEEYLLIAQKNLKAFNEQQELNLTLGQ